MNEQNNNAGATNIVNNNASGTDAGAGQVTNPAVTEKSDNSVNEQQSAVSGQGSENGADNGAGKQKPKQDSAKNAEFARQRREREKAEEKAKQELEFYKREIGVNPWTEQPIEDADDIAEYRLMKQIEKEGGDPLNDYAKRLKLQRKEKKEQKENKASNVSFSELTEEQKQARVNEEITEFSSQYPDVNVSELFENESFMDFAGEYLGKVSLSVAYGMYQKSASFKQAQNDAITKKATQLANSQASVGALSTAGKAEDGYFTKEQVLKMSPAEIKKNYEKIRESQAKW